MAGCVIVVGAVTIISSFRQLVAKVQTQQDEEVDVRKEDPWRNTPMILYFLVVMGIFLCACCMDTIFSSYLYIYATCSDTFDWSPKKANNLVTIFWIAFGISRALGIFLTPYIKPWMYILVDVIGSVFGVSLILAFDYSLDPGNGTDAMLVTSVVIFAFFVACIYGCATNMTNEYTNMSLTYIYITQLGNSIGAMSLPTVTGNLVSSDPIWFGWMVLIVSVGCFVFEVLIHLQGSVVQRKFAYLHEDEGHDFSSPSRPTPAAVPVKSHDNPVFEEDL